MSKLNDLYNSAKKYLIGGTTAGGRYHPVLGQPLYLKRASGSRLYDVEGNEYIDYHNSAGSAFFGYDHPRLRKAIEKSVGMGFFLNFETEYHQQLAKMLCEIIPSAERVRLSNTGTEVTMAAIRLARNYTGRDKIIKFEGHFHGMHELVWYNHSNVGEMDEYGEVKPLPDSTGMPEALADLVVVIQFNNIEALEHSIKKYKGEVAAVIMEPISFNCGCYPAKKGYLEKVRKICDQQGIVLIFDEVISGFRMRPGSAQEYYGVRPDLTTLGKALGGGFAIAALAGKEEIMKGLNPEGRTVMSGTYTGSLMPVLASIECLKMVKEPGFYEQIERKANVLYTGINECFQNYNIPGHVRGVGARFGVFFGVENEEDDFDWRKVAKKFDLKMSKRFIRECLNHGLYFHDYGNSPVPMHNGFSTAHSMEDIEITLDRLQKVFKKIKKPLKAAF